MSIISPKSGLSSGRQSRGNVPEVYGGKDSWKAMFWACQMAGNLADFNVLIYSDDNSIFETNL